MAPLRPPDLEPLGVAEGGQGLEALLWAQEVFRVRLRRLPAFWKERACGPGTPGPPSPPRAPRPRPSWAPSCRPEGTGLRAAAPPGPTGLESVLAAERPRGRRPCWQITVQMENYELSPISRPFHVRHGKGEGGWRGTGGILGPRLGETQEPSPAVFPRRHALLPSLWEAPGRRGQARGHGPAIASGREGTVRPWCVCEDGVWPPGSSSGDGQPGARTPAWGTRRGSPAVRVCLGASDGSRWVTLTGRPRLRV